MTDKFQDKDMEAVSGSRNSLRFLMSEDVVFSEGSLIDAIKECGVTPNRDAAVFQRLKAFVSERGELPFRLSNHEHHTLRNCETGKAIDYLIYRYKFFLASKEKEVFDFPPYMLIEPTSACNLRCSMCFQVDPTFTRKPFMGMMKMDLFRSIVDQAAEEGCYAITMASRGEPLMHPKFCEMIDYVSDKNRFHDIKINTNAVFLTSEISHRLLSSDLNIFVFSIDHYEKDAFEKVRVNADFDSIRKNIDELLEIRTKHYPNSKCEFRISGVRVDPSLDEEKFNRFWGNDLMSVSLTKMNKRWNTYANDPHPDNSSACNFLWDRMYVWFDGKCNPCDSDYKSFLSYGDASKTPLRDIWNGVELARLREAHLAGCRHELNPCDRCGLSF